MSDRDGGSPNPRLFRIPTIDELDAMRVDRGLSQKQLSREAGMEPDRFNTILHRDMDPQTETMRSFLRVLQETTPRDDDEIDRRGPKPRRSTLSTDDTDESGDLWTDGGEELESGGRHVWLNKIVLRLVSVIMVGVFVLLFIAGFVYLVGVTI